MVVPPEDGYGKQGNPQAGIKGTDTLVFVVDVIAQLRQRHRAARSAPPSPTCPTASRPSAASEQPDRHRPEGHRAARRSRRRPSSPRAPATGRQGQARDRAVHRRRLDRQAAEQHVGARTAGLPDRRRGQPSPFDLLEGVPIGSRVLLQLPAPAGERRRARTASPSSSTAGPARPGQGGGQRMTDKPEIDFPEGPPPTDLEINDLTEGDGAEARPAAPPSSTTSASRSRPARSSTPPGTAASRSRSRSAPARSSPAGTAASSG